MCERVCVFDEGSKGESASFKGEFLKGKRIKVDLEMEGKAMCDLARVPIAAY